MVSARLRARSAAIAVVAVIVALLFPVVGSASAGAAPIQSIGQPLARPLVGVAAHPGGRGLWTVGADGGVFTMGDASFFGSTGAMRLNQPIVGMAASPSGGGYWLVASDGGIFSFGDASFFGSTGAVRLNQPIVGMAASPSGGGYWLVASDGGIFSFGDASFFGSTGAVRLNQPIVGMAASPSGGGYWLVASDGGIFSFGDASFFGSTGAMRLNQPIVGMAATASGGGYRFVARDGGVFAFGDATFAGSPASTAGAPVIGLAPLAAGYAVVRSDGTTWSTADRFPTPSARKQGGITHPSWWHDQYEMAESDDALSEIAATGAGWVVLVPTWYQDAVTSVSIRPIANRSASEASVRHAIRTAKARGLRVFLKPHVDLRSEDPWRGEIRPADRAAWFASYTSFITSWASVAQQEGVEQFSVGTELASMSPDTASWAGVIAAVRAQYGGALTYAANFDEYSHVQFWDRLDMIGVDAYFELVSVPTTDVGVLRTAWAPIAERLRATSSRWGKPILFTEAGYVSQVGTTTAPWDWTLTGIRSDVEQAAAYQALFEAFWAQSWFAGVHWWMWDDFADGDEDQALDYTPHGKPAEQVLSSYFRS